MVNDDHTSTVHVQGEKTVEWNEINSKQMGKMKIQNDCSMK